MKPAPTNNSDKLSSHPPIVSREEWQRARDQLLVKEKAATRARDALSAERRRLPMVRIEKDYVFDGPAGKVSLLDLFEGRRQLIIYHFMFAPGVDGWPTAGCPGCSMVVDYFGPLAHLQARDTSLVLVSLAPVENLTAYQQRMGWTVPWYSSHGTTFNQDFGLSTAEGKRSASAFFCAMATMSFTPTSPPTAPWKSSIPTSLCSTGHRSAVRRNGKTRPPVCRNLRRMCGGAATTSIRR